MLRLYTGGCIVAAFFGAAFCWGQIYSISTFAGQGPALGDGGPAAGARFGSVSAVATGPDGSVYVADSAYHQVRKIGSDGKISLFAGSSVRGFGGDGGPATAAMLDTPTALAVDSGGYVYIGDSGNHRVRVVSIYGNIQTFAGNGQVAPSPAASPVLPGEGGPATAAPLNQIAGIGFASNGDLLIVDSGNNRLFRVSFGIISTIAGNATTPATLASQPALSATLNAPTGVVCDYLGNVYFTEQNTGVVRKIDGSGKMTVLIGTGLPGAAPVNSGSPLQYPLLQPTGLAMAGRDALFILYIIETGRISVYTPPLFGTNGPGSVKVAAGDLTQKVVTGTGDGGPALAAGMNPRSVAVDTAGNVYLADSSSNVDLHNRVRVITGSNITTFAGGNVPTGKGDTGTASAAQLYFPRALAIDPAGNVYIADTADNRVRTVTADGKIQTFAGTGAAGLSGDQGPAIMANLNPPTGIAIDPSGNLYIDDGSVIRQVNSSGIITTFAGGGTSNQDGAANLTASLLQGGSLAVDAQNNVFVDQMARVSKFSADTQTISTVAGNGISGYSGDNGPATAAQIDDIAGIAVDSGGNLYIADEDNGRVRKVDSSGNITTIAGGGTSTDDGVMATTAVLNLPLGVAADNAGNIYVAEYGGNRVRMIDSSGAIHTIAGNGLQGYSGDGSMSTNASLNGPTDVKVDGQGNVYIADSLNSAIRKLTPITAAPVPSIAKVSNGASFANGPVAPGERVIITGTALGPRSKISFDGTPAPVLSSSPTSAMVVVPYEVAGQTTSQLTVTTGGASSAPFAVQVAPSAPGIFTVSGDGTGPAVAFSDNGEYNSLSNPATSGGIVTVICTGAGVLNPAVATGVPVPPTTPSPVLRVTATLDGIPAEVDQAYSLPGTIGQFAVDVRIPSINSSAYGATVQIKVGNAMSQNATVAVVGSQDSGDNGGGGDGGAISDFLRRKSNSRPLPPVH